MGLLLLAELGRPLYEGVDWNIQVWYNIINERGRPLYEGVDWNRFKDLACKSAVCRPLYEGVDWNTSAVKIFLRRSYVALFTRAWIEIHLFNDITSIFFGRPLYEGVDWNSCRCKTMNNRFCRPLYEGVDWNKVQHQVIVLDFLSPSLRGRGLKYFHTLNAKDY